MSWIKDIVNPKLRLWEEFYRNRWAHDLVVRSTHGVNCTGGCSWLVHVKDGVVAWEMQAVDYPRLDPALPGYEPRGCQRGIVFSWYVYSPLRVKHPLIRGVLADAWRDARAVHADPVSAWEAVVANPQTRRRIQAARGRGGFRRTTWEEGLEIIAASMLYTARKYGPDRVIGFSPIPAMSMVSYAAGSRLLQLFGGAMLSFYDLYADFPPASPETWGEKTDVSESADWYNSKYIVVEGSNLNMTRTPDVHFAAEARNHGAKLVVLSPDFSQVSRYADWWIPVNAGMDGAFWMALNHVLLKEFHVDRQVPYFTDYLKRFSDAPFLVELEKTGDGYRPGRFLRAARLARYAGVENAEWKFLVFDRSAPDPRMPQGSIGFRWQERPGQWNLEPKDGLDGSPIDPVLSLAGNGRPSGDGPETRPPGHSPRPGGPQTLPVDFPEFVDGRRLRRAVTVRTVETRDGPVPVATVFDLLLAQSGVSRGPAGDYPQGYDDESMPYTPAWQEKLTGVSRDTVIRMAREWAATAEETRGRCMIIVGSGINHWYHGNLTYRAGITSLLLTGCVGVNGGGLNHYTGQEKIAPAASWTTLAMALDWVRPPRLQNGPSFHYVHGDQWHYERTFADFRPPAGRFAGPHTMDLQADAVRMGWLPFYPQFDQSPAAVAAQAEEAGCRSDAEVAAWVARRLKERRLRLAVDDPDAPENWPRVWLIWRANALHASAKGQEYLLRHYLGTEGNAIAPEVAGETVQDVVLREPAPRGKMDLVVDVNFRLDTTALFSDIVLPSASWYEKKDLNTTDLHSYIHPLGQAVPPCWESRTDWDLFRDLAAKISELARDDPPFGDLVATPLLHDTRDEIAQGEVRNWYREECDPVPGRTMPRFTVVERDYANLYHRFCSLGPLLKEEGVEDRGIHIPVADLYDEFAGMVPACEWNGRRYPSLVDPVVAADAILWFAPETNGEVAWRGFQAQERRCGVPLADLAAGSRAERVSYQDLQAQPRRLLTSPCWSGIMTGGRAYAAYCQNVERLVPWRTLTGRQHLYLDHEAYRAFGESLATFKARIGLEESLNLVKSSREGRCIVLNCLTPHGKWHMHTTYYDDLRMLTLSRGIEPFWMNDRDAGDIGVGDNDWVEVYNDNGVFVTRAAVSARLPRGIGFLYHAPERNVSVPRSPARNNRRGGGTNSVTRLRLKPVLMAGGYAQHCYRFNDYGPAAPDRDTYVLVRRLPGRPVFD